MAGLGRDLLGRRGVVPQPAELVCRPPGPADTSAGARRPHGHLGPPRRGGHVRGGKHILAELEKQLGIKAGNTTDDQKFTLETIACLGACGMSPVMQINGETYGRLTSDDISRILASYE